MICKTFFPVQSYSGSSKYESIVNKRDHTLDTVIWMFNGYLTLHQPIQVLFFYSDLFSSDNNMICQILGIKTTDRGYWILVLTL